MAKFRVLQVDEQFSSQIMQQNSVKKMHEKLTKTKPCMQLASLQNIDTETIKIIT